ncbi:hypothetical protein DPMN_100926 [Dreissena polymorpha]|uniref:Uncharacterized protein n=1 Tax=Dreissena polymorpha TaxID=45954 RepID=A0A9D4LI65_DREPO|nr:hypothetical protein DPMN_100926 [Dreissena polymorpha]
MALETDFAELEVRLSPMTGSTPWVTSYPLRSVGIVPLLLPSLTPFLMVNQLGMDVVHFRRISCLTTTHCLLNFCLKYGRTFVVRFWSGIVLKETGVRFEATSCRR